MIAIHPSSSVAMLIPLLRCHHRSASLFCKALPLSSLQWRRSDIIAYRCELLNRYKSTGNQTKSSSALTETSQESDYAVSTTVKEKVKENVKTSAYGSVVLIGIVVTGAMAYLILSELFSSDSPNSIYTKSFKLCKANSEVQDVLGEPLKCYGEESRRGWRRHVAHQKFLVGETKYIRMKFYLEGKFNKGTVYLEKKTNAQGKFEYSYLVVDVDTYPPRRIELDVSIL